jgi:single-stranded DNA-binding protein
MNHCVLEVDVLQAPTLRYTQDNQTPIAEMEVGFDALRADDPRGSLKVVGWGNLAQDLQNRVQVGQRLVIEGRLRMNTVPRQDGTKEKRAEFTLSRLHPVAGADVTASVQPQTQTQTASSPQAGRSQQQSAPPQSSPAQEPAAQWNSAPLVPDTDDIPF